VRVRASVRAAVPGRGLLTSRTAATQSVRRTRWSLSNSIFRKVIMKKIVPDPPDSFPIPYITIIADLSPEDARSHAAALMDCLCKTSQLYLDTEAEDHRYALLENLGILTELLRVLVAHMAMQGDHP
jgi:hypothetical protein